MTDELPPIRCITCNKVLGHLWNDYQEMLSRPGVSIEHALNTLGLTRPCCRLRLRNPFKVTDRNPQSQDDALRLFESNFETLSISVDTHAPANGALAALTNVTDMMIIPDEDEEEDILLPPIPTIQSTPEFKNFRTYQAW